MSFLSTRKLKHASDFFYLNYKISRNIISRKFPSHKKYKNIKNNRNLLKDLFITYTKKIYI